MYNKHLSESLLIYCSNVNSSVKNHQPPSTNETYNNEKITTSIFVGLIESTIRSRLAFILFTSSEIAGYVTVSHVWRGRGMAAKRKNKASIFRVNRIAILPSLSLFPINLSVFLSLRCYFFRSPFQFQLHIN